MAGMPASGTSDASGFTHNLTQAMLAEHGKRQENDNESEKETYSSAMCSVDFHAPLSQEARNEKVKQICKKHPALVQTRRAQGLLADLQTTIRRMPGVSAVEGRQIIDQLREVSQVTSQETSKLVGAIAHLTIDSDDTDRSIARMSLDHNLVKATSEDTIQKLKQELVSEKDKRTAVENVAREVSQDMEMLKGEFEEFRVRVMRGLGGSPDTQNDIVKHLEGIICHLEGQVNNRRSLWVMKHDNPRHISKAIGTMADSLPKKPAFERSLSSLRLAGEEMNGIAQKLTFSPNEERSPQGDMGRPPHSDFLQLPPRVPVGYPSQSREDDLGSSQMAVHRAAFTPASSGPGRNPPSGPSSRFQTWDHGPHADTQHSRTGAMARSMTSPCHSRNMALTPSRRGFGAYRGAPTPQPDLQGAQQQFQLADPFVPQHRPKTSLGNHSHSNGHGSARGDYSSQTVGRNRYSNTNTPRLQELFDPSTHPPTGPSSALVHRNVPVCNMPLVHLTERSVSAWATQIGEFYSVIRDFVENQAGEAMPRSEHEKIWRSNIWMVLVRTYLPLSEAEAASYLAVHLTRTQDKRCLVTRVIIDYVVNLVWIPGAWKGADRESTRALIDLEHDLAQVAGLTAAIRQPLLDRQSAILDGIMQTNEPRGPFYSARTAHIATSLLESLQPLLDTNRTTPSAAYQSLHRVAVCAWDLSSKILTSRLTFDFRFPEIGSRFSCQSMLPIWPTDIGAMELQAKHWRVALVTTPVVTCRNDTGFNISAHSVSLADVICMQ
ncbi:uncharacterized protein J7T54_003727 [Emericellopsis cladophorae]|uniref:Uncharacterized protein n=1 Tax=Emericellopsis cladophorae TaxID=2686198 RepID=A0A9P9XXQ6_9HYPO|nr:uncharacterized protein J7T54_003727 [Emericellopsis cladophorae]KAI6779803.1 hypothetical protein J7T54_003727 [Emericellopsis cladophorae]